MPPEVYRWRHGGCYAMALALHEVTGLPIQALTALPNPNAKRRHPAHVWVVTPEGKVLDSAGTHSLDAIWTEYLGTRPEFVKNSAQIEHFTSAEAYLLRMQELFGDDAEWHSSYAETLRQQTREARHFLDTPDSPLMHR